MPRTETAAEAQRDAANSQRFSPAQLQFFAALAQGWRPPGPPQPSQAQLDAIRHATTLMTGTDAPERQGVANSIAYTQGQPLPYGFSSSGGGGGGGAGGGGGGGAAPAAAPYTPTPLEDDPAWVRYLGDMEFARNEACRRAAEQRNAIKNEQPIQHADVARTYGRAREQISGGMEARGLFRSGEHEVNLARNRGDEQRTLTDLERSTASRLSGIDSALAESLAAMDRQRADRELDERMRRQSEYERARRGL